MSELLKQREAFLKRAQNVPVIENKSAPASKRPRLETSKSRGKVVPVKNFHLIHKIVTHMKNRHLQNELLPLSLDDVLEECNSTTTVCSERGAAGTRRRASQKPETASDSRRCRQILLQAVH